MLQRWYKSKEKYIKSTHKKKRFKLICPTDNGQYPIMEDELDMWIQEKRALGCCLSSFVIKVRAMEILKDLVSQNTQIDFRGSDGWFNNFLRRKNYSLRRITTAGF